MTSLLSRYIIAKNTFFRLQFFFSNKFKSYTSNTSVSVVRPIREQVNSLSQSENSVSLTVFDWPIRELV